MKIEKIGCSYQVTECDLKFGEQITLSGELLVSASVLDKIRDEIETHRRKTESIDPYDLVGDCLDIINKYREGKQNDRIYNQVRAF